VDSLSVVFDRLGEMKGSREVADKRPSSANLAEDSAY
jgi:hypothetical protein